MTARRATYGNAQVGPIEICPSGVSLNNALFSFLNPATSRPIKLVSIATSRVLLPRIMFNQGNQKKAKWVRVGGGHSTFPKKFQKIYQHK